MRHELFPLGWILTLDEGCLEENRETQTPHPGYNSTEVTGLASKDLSQDVTYLLLTARHSHG